MSEDYYYEGRCRGTGGSHDWSNSYNDRTCRACGLNEATRCRGTGGGHDWESNYHRRRICRKCGLEQHAHDDGGAGW